MMDRKQRLLSIKDSLGVFRDENGHTTMLPFLCLVASNTSMHQANAILSDVGALLTSLSSSEIEQSSKNCSVRPYCTVGPYSTAISGFWGTAEKNSHTPYYLIALVFGHLHPV